MEKINWSNYTGTDFQLFCNCLLSMEVGKVFIPFTAPGKDNGIDGSFQGKYSGKKGVWRFQYKFHNVARKQGVAALKTDLKNEISNIRDEAHFVLITNVELLPQELSDLVAVWDKAKTKVQLEIWDGAKLFTLCLQFPILSLWLSEGFDTAQLLDYKIVFKSNLEGDYKYAGTFNMPFISREKEISSLKDFLRKDEKMTLVSGEAGIGKTRMVIEFFKQVVDNLDNWVPLVLLNRSIDFDKIKKALSGNKNYVILIDDAHGFAPEIIADMQRLSEVMEGKVKLILTARLLQAFTSLKLIKEYEKQKILHIKLDELSRSDTKELLSKELSGHYYSGYLTELTTISYGKPILIVAIIRAAKNNIPIAELKLENFLTDYVTNYFESFYDTIIAETNTPKIRLQKLLQFVCLIEPFNYFDIAIVKKLSETTSIESDVVDLVLRRLKEGGLATGRYEQSIKPDYYSDMILMTANAGIISGELARFVEFLVNIITNLSSVDEVKKEKGSLLEMILGIYIQNITDNDSNSVSKIIQTINTITYVKPDIAIEAIKLYFATIENSESLLSQDFAQFKNYYLNSGESPMARIKQILRDLLYYPKHFEFVYHATFKLNNLLGDSKIATKVFDYARRDYIDGYRLNRQDFFVSKLSEEHKELDAKDLIFGLECCKEFLQHEFTDASSDGANRNSISITTFYLPNHVAVKKIRKKIIQLLIDIYTFSREDVVRKRALDEILDIPRGIFATKTNKTVYKGDDEISLVLDFIISVAKNLQATFQKSVLDRIYWYRKWGISKDLYGKLDEIKVLLAPESLTEKLVHLFTKTENLLSREAEEKLREKSQLFIAKYDANSIAESLIELTADQQESFHYLWSFLSTLSREFPEQSQKVYSLLWEKSPKIIYQFGNLFLQDLYFVHQKTAFYWEQVKALQNANNSEADNIILRIYSHRDFKAGVLGQRDINLIKRVAKKKDPKSNFDLARALLAVITYDEALAEKICGEFLGRCGSREADIFFIFLSEERMPLYYDLCKKLVLKYSVRFPIGYEIEKGLNRIVQKEGIGIVFNYFLERFSIKMKDIEEKKDALRYDWVPHGDHSHLFDGCKGDEKQDFFLATLHWFIELKGDFMFTFFGKNLLDYARPTNSLSEPLLDIYEKIASEVMNDNKKLCRLFESLSIFQDKDVKLVNLVLSIYNKAYKIHGQDDETFKDVRYQSYSAITSMGVKSGTAGQPFSVDIALRDLLTTEILNHQEYSPAYKFLSDVINSVEKDIQSQYERGNDIW